MMRPIFTPPTGLPEKVTARIVEKANASYCYVPPHGGSFYIDETRAKRMQQKHGGTIFAPIKEQGT
jgi:hypothetical protein